MSCLINIFLSLYKNIWPETSLFKLSAATEHPRCPNKHLAHFLKSHKFNLKSKTCIFLHFLHLFPCTFIPLFCCWYSCLFETPAGSGSVQRGTCWFQPEIKTNGPSLHSLSDCGNTKTNADKEAVCAQQGGTWKRKKKQERNKKSCVQQKYSLLISWARLGIV